MLDLTGPDLTGDIPGRPRREGSGEPRVRPFGGRNSRPSRAMDNLRDPDCVISGENFPVATRLLPARLRRHLLALYRYARLVDDIGDEPAAGGHLIGPLDRLAALDRLEAEVRGCYQGRPPGHPVLIRLAPTVAACRLPADPLLRLIDANRRDQVVSRYPSFVSLVDYCHLSADPVGELVLHVFEAYTPGRGRLSDRICTALQIVEHLQDVAEDRRRGRIYLPADDLAAHRVAETDLDAPRAGGPLREVVRRQADRAADLLDAGTPLIGELRGWARLAVAGYVAGGRAALAALARQDHDPLPGPPRSTRPAVARYWVRALLRGTR